MLDPVFLKITKGGVFSQVIHQVNAMEFASFYQWNSNQHLKIILLLVLYSCDIQQLNNAKV